MGFLNRRNIAAAIQLSRDRLASVPQWARITKVGHKAGPFQTLNLEIHAGFQPPYEVTTTVWLPRGVTPRVGQDVAYRISTGDDHTHYAIDWDKPPKYGNPPAAGARQEAGP